MIIVMIVVVEVNLLAFHLQMDFVVVVLYSLFFVVVIVTSAAVIE